MVRLVLLRGAATHAFDGFSARFLDSSIERSSF